MARLWSSGFELNSATSGVEWSTTSGSPTISSTTFRGGAFAGRITSLVSATPKFFRSALPSTYTTIYARTYFRYHTLPGNANSIFELNSTGTMRVRLKLTAAGALQLSDEDGIIGTSDVEHNPAADTWYCVQLVMDQTGGVGAHTVYATITPNTGPDNIIAFSSARSISTSVNQVTLGGNLASEAQSVGDWFFDDFAVNDNSGTAQTGEPGAGTIVHLHPTSDIQAAGFALTGAATESGCVGDASTPDDATTRVTLSASTQQGIYALTDTPADLATATLVSAGWRATSNAASLSNQMFLHIRTATTDAATAATTSSVAAYRTNNFASATDTTYPLTKYLNIDAGTPAWTKAALDDLRLGLQRGASNTSNPSITDIWALVDYITNDANVSDSITLTENALETAVFNAQVQLGIQSTPGLKVW